MTSKHTYIAPFVNAEESEYLVIEDDFPNGRPPLEAAGFIFAARDTVNKVERMKVCTCLNPLHTALAVFGCLLRYEHIWQEMRDPELRQLLGQADLVLPDGAGVVLGAKLLGTPLKQKVAELLEKGKKKGKQKPGASDTSAKSVSLDDFF